MPHPADRGRLRVYLGAAPGVGKTYAMLDEGRRRVERGTDLVVGYVETHGRPKTERELEGLEVVPRAKVAYRGTVQEEMDLDAILRRHPHVVLVDELAHTNVPGSVHEKRWQDVEALLDAGIEVITTVNIQHLESLNDVTEQITGVRQRETVPDHVVRSADQIELVDMSPQALRRRMAHGNIYTADKIDAALSRYFREGNLTALRELALLWLADRVDEGLERYREQHEIDSTWATRERIVVPVSGGPESSTLMRRAARIASRRSGGEWQALYVTRQDGLTGIAPDQLTRLAAKADELGGTFHTVVGDDPADAILAFARAENATQIVIGASRRGRVSTLLRPGVGERVVTGSGDIDVHIVTHDYVGRAQLQPAADTLGRRRRLIGLAFGVLAPALLSLVLHQTKDLHGLPIEAMSLMVVVVATALIGGIAAAVVSALVSALLLNYLFTPPLYTLTIAEPENVVTIALFVAVGIAVATVVDTAARRTAQARAARAEADALTVLAHSLLTSSDDTDGLLSSACRLFNASGAAVVRRDETGAEEVVASCGTPPVSVERADMAAAIDDRNTLVLAGATLPASERGLLNAYAAYAKVMAERRLATVAEVERLRLDGARPDPDGPARRRVPRPPQPARGDQGRRGSLRTTDVTFSPDGRGRAARDHRGVDRPAHRARRQPARHEPDQHRLRDAPLLHRGRPGASGPREHRAAGRRRAHRGRRRPRRWWCSPTPGCSTGWWPTSARTPSSTRRRRRPVRIDAAADGGPRGRRADRRHRAGGGRPRPGAAVRAVPAVRRRAAAGRRRARPGRGARLHRGDGWDDRHRGDTRRRADVRPGARGAGRRGDP